MTRKMKWLGAAGLLNAPWRKDQEYVYWTN